LSTGTRRPIRISELCNGHAARRPVLSGRTDLARWIGPGKDAVSGQVRHKRLSDGRL
jgi:hypothetical protein